MKALVKYAVGKGNVDVREIPEPVPTGDQVKIRVELCGICGTDIHVLNDDPYPYTAPKVLGHEFSGVVEEFGERVTAFRPGDRVTGIPVGLPCGQCHYCRTGHYFQCRNRTSYGNATNGGFATHTVVREPYVRRLPDNVGFAAGALIEPLACCSKAVNFMTDIRAGDVALVIGPGPIGLLAMQLAKAEGAAIVLAGTDADADRLAMGKQLGADVTVNVSREPGALRSALAEITGGEGADVVLECSGTPGGTRAGLEAIRPEGRFTQIGLHDREFPVDVLGMLLKDLRFAASYASSAQGWERGIQLVAQGRVQLEPLVSHTLPMSDWEKGFDLLRSRQALKVLLRPGE